MSAYIAYSESEIDDKALQSQLIFSPKRLMILAALANSGGIWLPAPGKKAVLREDLLKTHASASGIEILADGSYSSISSSLFGALPWSFQRETTARTTRKVQLTKAGWTLIDRLIKADRIQLDERGIKAMNKALGIVEPKPSPAVEAPSVSIEEVVEVPTDPQPPVDANSLADEVISILVSRLSSVLLGQPQVPSEAPVSPVEPRKADEAPPVTPDALLAAENAKLRSELEEARERLANALDYGRKKNDASTERKRIIEDKDRYIARLRTRVAELEGVITNAPDRDAAYHALDKLMRQAPGSAKEKTA